MLQTRLLCLPPPSPRSTTSSWAHSTAYFVSSHNKHISAVSPSLTSCLHDKSPQVHNLSLFFFLQVYCPSWATAFCYLLHITSGRPWSQLSSSSSISPSVTLGWRSLYSHWQYHHLFHTGISYSPLIVLLYSSHHEKNLINFSVNN